MAERMEYGRAGYEAGSEYDDYQEDNEEDNEEDYEDYDYEDYKDYEEEDHAAGLQGAVEHQAEYAADDGAEATYGDNRFGWLFRARRNNRGRLWTPPDTRGLKAPLFVRLDDLINLNPG